MFARVPLVEKATKMLAQASPTTEPNLSNLGINFTDVLVILGHISGTYVGCEYSGVIRRVGSAVTAHSPGDRVCFIGGDGFKTFVRAEEYALTRIPDSLPFTEAFAAIYLTAIYAINHLGRLRRGESILIHAAAGGVGQAAIKLAQHIGADLFVTVSSRKKKELVQELYGIPDNRVFFSRDLSFGRQIMHATNGHGIDVVLNSVSDEGLAESWRVIAPLGRFIGTRQARHLHLPVTSHARRSLHSTALMGQMTAELEDMLAKGIFATPKPLSVFSRAEFESAIRYLQTGRHMGKVVIEALLSCAGSLDEAGSIIAAALVKRLARVLSLPEEDIDTNRPIHLYGVDSLVAVELRFWFSTGGVQERVQLSSEVTLISFVHGGFNKSRGLNR
ncbi:hypothetical protein NUW58_g2710 [Xylaria curta]|uniref:Uncharacterized protein n=1 Tax=Xylaria curta TaxID=42375 RepID=A0ACC1PGX7_9PEZI|nr:hypothetical protein NUW58_g2710 [Xylaria curta]